MTAEENDFIAGLLNEVDQNIPSRFSPPIKEVKSQARRTPRVISPMAEETKIIVSGRDTRANETYLSTPPVDGDADFCRGFDDDDVLQSDPILPSSPVASAVERKTIAAVKAEEDEDEEMEVLQVTGIAAASVNMSGSRPVPKIKHSYPSPVSSSPSRPSSNEINAPEWNDITRNLNVIGSPASGTVNFGKLNPEDAIENDGSLRVFWLDYTEVNGSLCLFGKVKNKQNGSYVSCFVKVDNILRKLFFLPRKYRQSMFTVFFRHL